MRHHCLDYKSDLVAKKKSATLTAHCKSALKVEAIQIEFINIYSLDKVEPNSDVSFIIDIKWANEFQLLFGFGIFEIIFKSFQCLHFIKLKAERIWLFKIPIKNRINISINKW